MTNTMDTWDREIAPYLSVIDMKATAMIRYAGFLKHEAASLSNAIGLLELRPSFETEARAQLDEAAERLTAALDAVNAARERYDALPVEQSKQAAE